LAFFRQIRTTINEQGTLLAFQAQGQATLLAKTQNALVPKCPYLLHEYLQVNIHQTDHGFLSFIKDKRIKLLLVL
jgi:hypothetical protein